MRYKFDGKQPVVGCDTYVSHLATLIGDVAIGDNCYIGHGAIVRGDYGKIEIGNGTAIEEGAVLHAPPGDCAHIGDRVTVGHSAVVHGKCVGDFAVVGMGAVISMLAEIGTWTIVAEGSVVKLKQRLPDRIVAAGNPARIVREIRAEDEQFWTWGKQLYIDLAQKYLTEGLEPVDA